ncbi:MAG: hypothetical protein WC730_02500 [Patescibacteria group bacterium]|jgi:hypothetical protein
MKSFGKTFEYSIEEFFGQFFFWITWWYSRGFFDVVTGLFGIVSSYAKSLGLRVWIKNIFVPMYGVNDWQGRLISIFMRFVQIIGRGILFCFFCLLAIVGVCGYLLLPVALILFVLYHLFGLYVI